MPNAFSILQIVSNDMFFCPFSTLEMYCWVQLIFPASICCVSPSSDIRFDMVEAIAVRVFRLVFYTLFRIYPFCLLYGSSKGLKIVFSKSSRNFVSVTHNNNAPMKQCFVFHRIFVAILLRSKYIMIYMQSAYNMQIARHDSKLSVILDNIRKAVAVL